MSRDWTPVVALLAVAPLLLGHCSGTPAKVGLSSSNDGGRPSNSSGSSSGGSNDSGSSPILGGDDGGGVTTDATVSMGTDAGGRTPGADSGTGPETPACNAPNGGQPCDPGLVSCGGTSCTTSSQFCCMAGSADGGPAGTCDPYNSSTCPSGALTLGCDETGDCSSGICCEQIIGLGIPGPTQCMAACPVGWFQICKAHSECGGGSDAGAAGRCILQTCTQPPGLLGGGSSVVVEACAVPPTLTNLNNNGALAGCVAH